MMIKQQERTELEIELSTWLNSRGWRISSSAFTRIGLLELRLNKIDKPPDLGVHVADGVGTDDKVG
jgi:hypothetical protein